MSSKNYEESGYDLDLDLVIISYQLCVSCPGRNGIVGKGDHVRPIYLPCIVFFI